MDNGLLAGLFDLDMWMSATPPVVGAATTTSVALFRPTAEPNPFEAMLRQTSQLVASAHHHLGVQYAPPLVSNASFLNDFLAPPALCMVQLPPLSPTSTHAVDGGCGSALPLAKRFKTEPDNLDTEYAVPVAPADLEDPTNCMVLTVHVNGYKQPCKVTLLRTDTVAVACRKIMRAQESHPNSIQPHEQHRAVILTTQPTTMNTTCKFDEADVLGPSDNDAHQLSLMHQYAALNNVYVYLLCPEISLATERGAHRRLAKRDAGVCEAHRGQSVRAQKKSMESLGIVGTSEYVFP